MLGRRRSDLMLSVCGKVVAWTMLVAAKIYRSGFRHENRSGMHRPTVTRMFPSDLILRSLQRTDSRRILTPVVRLHRDEGFRSSIDRRSVCRGDPLEACVTRLDRGPREWYLTFNCDGRIQHCNGISYATTANKP